MHGASKQCWQATESKVLLTRGKVPVVISRTRRSLTVPGAIPRHCLQAISQVKHLMQRRGS